MINYLQSFKWCPLTFSMMYALHFAYFDPIICHKTMKFNGQYQKLLFLFQTDQLFNFISFSITCTLFHTHSTIPVLKNFFFFASFVFLFVHYQQVKQTIH